MGDQDEREQEAPARVELTAEPGALGAAQPLIDALSAPLTELPTPEPKAFWTHEPPEPPRAIVAWHRVPGAARYEVLRGMTPVGETPRTHFVDPTAQAGGRYLYGVVALGEEGTRSEMGSVQLETGQPSAEPEPLPGLGDPWIPPSRPRDPMAFRLLEQANASGSLMRWTGDWISRKEPPGEHLDLAFVLALDSDALASARRLTISALENEARRAPAPGTVLTVSLPIEGALDKRTIRGSARELRSFAAQLAEHELALGVRLGRGLK